MLRIGDKIVMSGTGKWVPGPKGPTIIRTIVRVGARLAKWGSGPDDGVGADWTASTPEEVRAAEALLAARDARRKAEGAAQVRKEADPIWRAADRIGSWFGARETDEVMRLGAARLTRIEAILKEGSV